MPNWNKDGTVIIASPDDFVKRIMSPMPLIMPSRGPKDTSRHWDWKARSGPDIIKPVEPKLYGREVDFVIFDEASDVKMAEWKKNLVSEYTKMSTDDLVGLTEGSLTSSKEEEKLTVEKLTKAVKSLEDADMARKKIPKKRQPRGDPRKANYSGRMLGNILLSTTEQIENNTTLNYAVKI